MISGGFSTEYQTNNGLVDYSLNVNGNIKGIVWDVRYSDKYAHAYRNRANGWVRNSGFGERAASAMVGLNRNWGYLLLNASLGTDVLIRGKKWASIYILADNLTDCAWQSHLSRLKWAGVFNMGRNFTVKMVWRFS